MVRAAFVISALLSGFGAAAYVVAWLLLPAEDATDGAIASRALADRRGIALAAGLVSVLVVILLIGTALGAAWLGSLAWPGVITLAGLVLIWRNADPDEQAVAAPGGQARSSTWPRTTRGPGSWPGPRSPRCCWRAGWRPCWPGTRGGPRCCRWAG